MADVKSLISQEEYEQAVKKFEKFLDERLRLRKPLEHHQPPLTSRGSKRVYLSYVKKFLNDMGFEYPLPFTSQVAREYLNKYRSRGAKPRTLLLIYSALKNFYACMGWPWDIDYHQVVTEDYDYYVEAPYLTKEEMDKVLDYAYRQAKMTGWYRDALIVWLVRQAIRPEDVSRLRISNISKGRFKSQNGSRIIELYKIKYVPCKRGRETVKILDPRGSEIMDGWLEFLRQAILEAYRGRWKRKVFEDLSIRADINVPEMIPLFPRYLTLNWNPFHKHQLEDIQPLGRQSIYYIVQEMVLSALGRDEEVRRKAHPYAFRRGIITYYLDPDEAGDDYKPPHEVEKWVGWKTVGMSRIYDKKERERVAQKFVEGVEF